MCHGTNIYSVETDLPQIGLGTGSSKNQQSIDLTEPLTGLSSMMTLLLVQIKRKERDVNSTGNGINVYRLNSL